MIIIIIINFIYIALFNDPKSLTEIKTQKDNKKHKKGNDSQEGRAGASTTENRSNGGVWNR